MPNTAEEGANCGWAEYVLNGAGFGLKNYHVAGGKLREIDGSAKLAADAGKTGKLIFSYPYGGMREICTYYKQRKRKILFKCMQTNLCTFAYIDGNNTEQ